MITLNAIYRQRDGQPAPIIRSPKIMSRNFTITRTPFRSIHRHDRSFLAFPHAAHHLVRVPSLMGRNHLPSIGKLTELRTEFVRDRKFSLPFNSSGTLSIKNRTLFCTELWSSSAFLVLQLPLELIFPSPLFPTEHTAYNLKWWSLWLYCNLNWPHRTFYTCNQQLHILRTTKAKQKEECGEVHVETSRHTTTWAQRGSRHDEGELFSSSPFIPSSST